MILKLQDFRDQIATKVVGVGESSVLHPKNWDKQLEKISSGDRLFYLTREALSPYNLSIQSVFFVRNGQGEMFVDL